MTKELLDALAADLANPKYAGSVPWTPKSAAELLVAAEEKMLRDGRRAKVQGEYGGKQGTHGKGDGTVPWAVHVLAWHNYAACGHGSQSAERMNERGGFGYIEMQCALAGHYNDCSSEHDHPPIPGWEPRVDKDDYIVRVTDALRVESERLRGALEEMQTKMRKKCFCHETGGGTIKCEWHQEWLPMIRAALEKT